MHQTGQSFRFLLNVENAFLYSSKSFPLKNLLVDIYFPKIIPRRARRIFEMDIFSTYESSRGPRNSNNEFRNERFRSFPNFHQSMNVIPAADLSTRPNSFRSLRVYAYPTYESPREQCSRRFGRLLGRERNRGGIDRGLKGMPIRWGAALLCPRGSAEARGVRWRERWKSPLRDWGPRFTRDCYLWGFEGDFSRLAAHSTEWLLWFADQAAFNHVRPPWNRVLRPF